MSELKTNIYSNLKTMTIVEYQKYVEEAENGYIRINKHPEDDNVVILNYTELTTFERRWNKQTMSARGLILDLTEANDNGIIYILAKPFDKFFNYGENLEYQNSIDFLEKPVVMEKMDGSLGISYFFKDEIRFATRGSFTSEQAIEATKIWKRNYADKLHWDSYKLTPITYLVEIIYPSNRVVVDYGGVRDLILLGVVYIFDIGGNRNHFIDVHYQGVIKEAGYLGMTVAKQYDLTLDKMLEMKKTIDANNEGWILRYGDKRVKIKGDEYLTVHKITYGLSDKAKFQAWAEGRLDEFIMMMPEEFRKELEVFGEYLDICLGLEKSILDEEYRQTRKALAKYIQTEVDKESQGFMFKGFDFKGIDEKAVRQHMFKNYRKYIEVTDDANEQA